MLMFTLDSKEASQLLAKTNHSPRLPRIEGRQAKIVALERQIAFQGQRQAREAIDSWKLKAKTSYKACFR